MPTATETSGRVTIQCPDCTARYLVQQQILMHRVKCTQCGAMFRAQSIESARSAPPVTVGERNRADPLLGMRLGHFRLIGVLGRGGNGAVYEAEDVVLQRKVAVKVLSSKKAAGDRSALEQFLREGRSACKLDHPNIVTIYHVGFEAGLYFIAMQLVRGGSAADFLKEHGPMTPKDATRVTLAVADALQAAHDEGIVHRDIKPGNLMLGPAWMVKVTDFGLATLEGTLASESGDVVVGTPGYLSPEACIGKPIDIRSDLYALGATYYALLVGRPPFAGPDSRTIMLKHVNDPVPDPRELKGDIPDGAVDVLMRSLEKDPDRRYRTASQMLEDLRTIEFGSIVQPAAAVSEMQRWATEIAAAQDELSGATTSVAPAIPAELAQAAARLTHERSGHPPSAPKMPASPAPAKTSGTVKAPTGSQVKPTGSLRTLAAARKRGRRGPMFALGVLALAAVAAGAVWVARRDREREDPAVVVPPLSDRHRTPEKKKAPEVAPDPKDPTPIPDPEAAPSLELAEARREFERLSVAVNEAHQGTDRRALIDALSKLSAVHRAFRASSDPKVRAYADQARHMVDTISRDPRTPSLRGVLYGHSLGVTGVVYPGPLSLVSAGADGTIRFWDLRDGVDRNEMRGHSFGIDALAISHDHKLLATGGRDHLVKVWDIKAEKERATFEGHDRPVTAVAFSHDRRTLASLDDDGEVRLWDLVGNSKPYVLKSSLPEITAIAFSPDADTLALGCRDRTVVLWSCSTRKRCGLLAGHAAAVTAVAYSHDGLTLVSGGADGETRRWDAIACKPTGTYTGPGKAVRSIAFSAEDGLVAAASQDRMLHVWHTADGKALLAVSAHDGWALSTTFGPARNLATGGADGLVKLWLLPPPPIPVPPK